MGEYVGRCGGGDGTGGKVIAPRNYVLFQRTCTSKDLSEKSDLHQVARSAVKMSLLSKRENTGFYLFCHTQNTLAKRSWSTRDHDSCLPRSRQKPSLLRNAENETKVDTRCNACARFLSFCVTLTRILKSDNNSILYLPTIEDFCRCRPVMIFEEFWHIVLRQLNG